MIGKKSADFTDNSEKKTVTTKDYSWEASPGVDRENMGRVREMSTTGKSAVLLFTISC